MPGRTSGVWGTVFGIATLVEYQKNTEYMQGIHPHSENDNILNSRICCSMYVALHDAPFMYT